MIEEADWIAQTCCGEGPGQSCRDSCIFLDKYTHIFLLSNAVSVIKLFRIMSSYGDRGSAKVTGTPLMGCTCDSGLKRSNRCNRIYAPPQHDAGPSYPHVLDNAEWLPSKSTPHRLLHRPYQPPLPSSSFRILWSGSICKLTTGVPAAQASKKTLGNPSPSDVESSRLASPMTFKSLLWSDMATVVHVRERSQLPGLYFNFPAPPHRVLWCTTNNEVNRRQPARDFNQKIRPFGRPDHGDPGYRSVSLRMRRV